MDSLDALIHDLQEAPEGNQELDERIAFQQEWRPEVGHTSYSSFVEHEKKHDYATAWVAHSPWRNTWNIPPYTTSIDVVRKQIPKGIGFKLSGPYAGDQYECILFAATGEAQDLYDDATFKATFANTPELAFCIAIFKIVKFELEKAHV